MFFYFSNFNQILIVSLSQTFVILNEFKLSIRILENERSEVTSLIRRHQKQNEDWWNSRIGENDMERDKLRKAWVWNYYYYGNKLTITYQQYI